MDASYDEIQLQVQVPVRVYSAKCNPIMAVIFFDFCGKPAQITIPAEKQVNLSTGYEVLREMLHTLARNLEPKSNYYMAINYIPVASQIEEMLRDFMLDVMPPPAPPVDWLGSYPLEWFLSMGRQQFLLTEDMHGKVCAMRETVWQENLPSTKDLPLIPRDLPSISTAHLKVAPIRCGRNRVSGSITVDMSRSHMGAQTYTFVCMRELGTRAAAEGCHRAMAFQVQQLELIAHACRGLGPEERRAICVPDIRACLYHEFASKPDQLPVGVLFDELPKLVPLRLAAAPPDVLKECVLKVCRTLEWLIEKGIGWGGSIAASHKGHTLLDAVMVDAFCRPWLMEGFTEVKEGKLLSDRISAHMLRMEFGLMGIEQTEPPAMAEHLHIFQAEIIGNHVEIIFGLNMKTFCLSVTPIRKQATKPPYFTRTCNSLVQLVLQANAGNWHFSRGQSQIHDILLNIPKAELLSLCRGMPKIPHFCYVQLYFCHDPRPCELQKDEEGDPVLRLTSLGHDVESHALDSEDRHFASLYMTAEIDNISASEVSVTPTTSISDSRICGEVYGAERAEYHCIAARYTSDRGARRWSCPERRQLITRQALQAACAADPVDIRVPELLAYLHDDDLECHPGARPLRVMGGLYEKIDGIPLRAVLAAARQGDSKVRVIAAQLTSMMDSLHRRGFVWGGESEARMLIDCLVVDKQGHPWLVDGFGATYHEDIVQSDDKALTSLLNQIKVYFPERADVSGGFERAHWLDNEG